MARLSNPQHEAFAQCVASGGELVTAYKAAGYEGVTDETCHAAGSRLARLQRIADRIAELRPMYLQRIADIARRMDVAGDERTVDLAIEGDCFSRLGRAKILAARRRLMLEVIQARAKHEVELGVSDGQKVPGAETGLVISSWKALGGKHKAVKTHAVDLPLLQEFRATEQQIAQELGQWVDKSEQQVIKRVEDIPQNVLEDAIKRGEEKLRQLEAGKLSQATDLEKRPEGGVQ